MRSLVEGRALVLGVMGRTSVEADNLIRSDLRRLDSIFADAYPPHWEPLPMHVAEWFERLGRFGVGGRLAIPQLREFQKHSDPFVRMWATEALTRVSPKAMSTSFLPCSGAVNRALSLSTDPLLAQTISDRWPVTVRRHSHDLDPRR